MMPRTFPSGEAALIGAFPSTSSLSESVICAMKAGNSLIGTSAYIRARVHHRDVRRAVPAEPVQPDAVSADSVRVHMQRDRSELSEVGEGGGGVGFQLQVVRLLGGLSHNGNSECRIQNEECRAKKSLFHLFHTKKGGIYAALNAINGRVPRTLSR